MSKAWFDAATWPIEAAIVWVATGNRSLVLEAVRLALQRRDASHQRLPTLGHWLVAREGLVRERESVAGALYREELREGWTPGVLGQRHPFDRALARTRQMLIDKPAKGQRGASQRESIPGEWWKSAILVDDRKRGVIARSSRRPDDVCWQHIDVPAAVFRALKGKRGRRAAGLSTSPRATFPSNKTVERLRHKKLLADAEWGIKPVRKSGGGRPQGSGDVH